jgi:hypothetical protein
MSAIGGSGLSGRERSRPTVGSGWRRCNALRKAGDVKFDAELLALGTKLDALIQELQKSGIAHARPRARIIRGILRGPGPETRRSALIPHRYCLSGFSGFLST